MTTQASSVLPSALIDILRKLGSKLDQGQRVEAEVHHALTLIAALPPQHLIQAEREIYQTAGLMPQWHDDMSKHRPLWGRRLTKREQLEHCDDLKYLYLFHRNGYLREAVLDKITGSVTSPFLLAAIVWRLNDWVPEVRQAAFRCAQRVFPLTSGDVIAQAAMSLASRRVNWSRWTTEKTVLNDVLARPDVSRHLARTLCEAQSGPAASVLRHCLQNDGLDPYLEALAGKARQAAVRAVALQTLIDGVASWTAGFEWQWIDKTVDRKRRVAQLRQRPVERGAPLVDLIRIGLGDRAVAVRRIALDGLIQYQADIPQAAALAREMICDPYPSVRERAEFILRQAKD